jgi:hypothetical protein
MIKAEEVHINVTIRGLFNHAVSSLAYITKNDRMSNDIGHGRKRSWPDLRYYPGVCLEGKFVQTGDNLT